VYKYIIKTSHCYLPTYNCGWFRLLALTLNHP